MESDKYKYGTIGYYRARCPELETERNIAQKESEYYQTELVKAHQILGRIIHQVSERWDTVRLTKYYPTNNLWNKRTTGNPEGQKR